MSLIVTGSIGIDSIEAPTGSVDDVLGGSAIYFAAAASFFSPVRLVGAVGDDFPENFLDTFKHFKVDLAGLEHRTGSRTFRWRGKYLPNMNDRETLDVQLNVLAESLPPVPEHYRDSQYIFLANTHPAGQLGLLDQFPTRQLVVADTMDLWIDTQRDTLSELLTRIDGLVLNDAEAAQLTGDSNLVRAAEKIVDMGPRFVIVKKGEHGSLLMHEEGCVVLPAFPARDVVDPTGAGDSFAGGLLGCLSQCKDTSLAAIRHAMACGTVIASFNIEAFSLGRMVQLTSQHVQQRLDDYRTMLQIGSDW